MFPQIYVANSTDEVRPGDIDHCIHMPPLPVEVISRLQNELVAAGAQIYLEGTVYDNCLHCGARTLVGVVVHDHGVDLLAYALCLSCWYGEQDIFVRG
jgi:hypothetical protein